MFEQVFFSFFFFFQVYLLNQDHSLQMRFSVWNLKDCNSKAIMVSNDFSSEAEIKAGFIAY